MRLATAAFLLLLGAVIFLALQDPRVAELFSSAEQTEEDPLAFLNEPVERRNKQTKQTKPAAGGTPEARTAPSPPQNLAPQVPNSTVVQVLTGVLRAKQLYDGISLSVSDRAVTVSGQVDSPDKKKAILEIIEKGRGRRQVDSSRLQVVE